MIPIEWRESIAMLNYQRVNSVISGVPDLARRHDGQDKHDMNPFET